MLYGFIVAATDENDGDGGGDKTDYISYMR